MKNSWSAYPVPFKFQVSDRSIFSVTVSLDMRNGFSLDDLSARPDPSPPVETPGPESSGFMIRSLPVAESIPPFKSFERYIRYIPHRYPRFFADVDQSFEEYAGKFSSKSRSTIRRKVRKFEKHCNGEMSWRSYRSPQEVTEFQAHARSVSALTYQERLMDAGLPDSDEDVRKMLELAEQNKVRAWVLFDGEKPVTYLYLEIEDTIALYRYLGFDPEYRRWSVGTILHWFALEELCNDTDITGIDFTEGAGSQKEFFSSGSAFCADVYFVQKSPAKSLLLRSHFLFNRGIERFGDWLERRGLKARIRRLLRFGVGSA